MTSRWLLYSHDALGLGHVRRMTSIAGAVLERSPGVSALLVTCTPQADALPMPPGLDYVKLPSARKTERDRYESRTLRLGSDALRELRAGLLENVVRDFTPGFTLVDKSPLGMMGELRPALERLGPAGSGRRLVLGWRDILDRPETVRRDWADGSLLEAIERWYDEVWVYGDPAVFDLRREYGMPDAIAERVRFLGYLAPRVGEAERAAARARWSRDGEPLIVATVGGGEDGEALLAAFLEAARRGMLPADARAVAVTGPFLPEPGVRRLAAGAPPQVSVTRFVPGLEAVLAAADAVVSMAGYNTTCEVLGAGTPAVLVPRRMQRDEQRLRAERLEGLGLVERVDTDALAARPLADALRRALARRRVRPAVALDGLERVADRVRDLFVALAGPRPSPGTEAA